MQNTSAKMSNWRINFLLKEYDVKTEDELNQKLNGEINTLPCVRCGKESDIRVLKTICGNPYCRDCYEN